MVVSQCQVTHRSNAECIAALWGLYNDGSFLDRADAQDRYLRLVDDRRAEETAIDPGIGDGEGAAGDLVGLEFFVRARWARSLAASVSSTRLFLSAP